MSIIKIEIKNCEQCPFKLEKNPYSTDGWDRMIDWYCGKTEPHRKIQGYVEWYEVKKIEIPNWCPILIVK